MIPAKCDPVMFWNGCLWDARARWENAMNFPQTYGTIAEAGAVMRRYGKIYDYINNRNYKTSKNNEEKK